jgi:tryptophan-rich sensory protein
MTGTSAQSFRKWGALALFLATVVAVSTLGSFVTLPKIPTWYAGLAKPPFNPPSWIFGPVWTTLYAMMAFAAWRIWLASGHPGREGALNWYFGQLALNALWSPVFFGLEQPGMALAIIVALLVGVAVTVWKFWTIQRLAGWLMAPYLAWTAFATLLNASIVALN